MLERFFRRFHRRTLRTYSEQLERYRSENPQSIEKERQQIQTWLRFVESSRRNERLRRTAALEELREVARTAFMNHPAATESDFLSCWPSIRRELLKQNTLEELTASASLSQRLASEYALRRVPLAPENIQP